MAYVITTPNLGFAPIASTNLAGTTMNAGGRQPGPELGDIVLAVDPTYGAGEFIYLQGVASTVLGSWVTYNADDFTTALLAADAIGPVAVSMSINLLGYYG